MKTLFHSLLLAVLLANPAFAQTNLTGTWQGRLEAAPGTTLTIQFVIAALPNGGYSTIVTSPDSGAIKNVRAASVKFADNRSVRRRASALRRLRRQLAQWRSRG